jgi:hypothetical protein
LLVDDFSSVRGTATGTSLAAQSEEDSQSAQRNHINHAFVVWHLLAASSGHTAKSFALNLLKGSRSHIDSVIDKCTGKTAFTSKTV